MATLSPDQGKKPAPGTQRTNLPGYNPMGWRRFWLVLFVLLVLNLIITSIIEAASTPASVTIPYNVFYSQVEAGNVINITATGDSITGTTRKAVSAGSGQPSATTFSTERPTFANDGLEAELVKEKVSILAEPPNPPTPLWETLLLGFGPALIIVFGIIYLMRRSASLMGGGAGGVLGRFGQSGARLYDPERPETTFADVAGIDEVKAELVEVVDFSRNPRNTNVSAARCRKASCSSARREPARRCSLERSPARPECRSSPSPPRSSSRRSSASARPACATSSRRHALLLRRSSSSTSWTPSAARDRRARGSAATRSRSRPSTRSSPRWTASTRTRV